MAVLFIGYPKRSTCKKAKKRLGENGITFAERDIVTGSPSTQNQSSRERIKQVGDRGIIRHSMMPFVVLV